MKTFKLGFGHGTQSVSIPEENILTVLTTNPVPEGLRGMASVQASLTKPIGTPRLTDIVKPGEKIALVTSDITRPLPSHVVLPPILAELEQAGIDKTDISIIFALGSHRPHTKAEMIKLVGKDIYNTYQCIDSNPNDVIHLGETSRGTPVDIFRPVAEADRRILVANIEYHYFAGYSGGIKALLPGVATRATIQANHSFMLEEGAHAGNANSPVRLDLEEAHRFCPADFIVNVVLDETKQIIHTVSGDYIKAHRAGCNYLDNIYKKPIQKPADIVIVSQGGAPKDLNLYQTQKALDNAKHAVRDGGIIIVVGSCAEGLGESTFETWMREAPNPESLLTRIRKNFVLGGHKAAAIAQIMQRAEIWLVSDMGDELVREIFMTPYKTAQEAMDAAFMRMGSDASVIVMPYGGSTLPIITKQ